MASAIPSLDELIDYVRTVTPDGDALAQLAEAMEIGRRLNEHGDHLDRPLRRPGAQVGSVVDGDRCEHGCVEAGCAEAFCSQGAE